MRSHQSLLELILLDIFLSIDLVDCFGRTVPFLSPAVKQTIRKRRINAIHDQVVQGTIAPPKLPRRQAPRATQNLIHPIPRRVVQPVLQLLRIQADLLNMPVLHRDEIRLIVPITPCVHLSARRKRIVALPHLRHGLGPEVVVEERGAGEAADGPDERQRLWEARGEHALVQTREVQAVLVRRRVPFWRGEGGGIGFGSEDGPVKVVACAEDDGVNVGEGDTVGEFKRLAVGDEALDATDGFDGASFQAGDDFVVHQRRLVEDRRCWGEVPGRLDKWPLFLHHSFEKPTSQRSSDLWKASVHFLRDARDTTAGLPIHRFAFVHRSSDLDSLANIFQKQRKLHLLCEHPSGVICRFGLLLC